MVWLMAHLAEPLMKNRGSLHGDGTGPKGIRVRAISPGPLATRAASSIPEFDDGAKLMTGDTIYIDGGYHVID